MPPFHEGPGDETRALPGGDADAWRQEPPRPLASCLPAGSTALSLADGQLLMLDCRDDWPADARIGPLQEHLLVVGLAPASGVQVWLASEPPRALTWGEGTVLLLPAGAVASLRMPPRHHLLLLGLRPGLVYGSDRAPRSLRACAGEVDSVALGLSLALQAAATRGQADPAFARHLAQALAAHLRAHHGQPAQAERPGLSQLRLRRVLEHLHTRLDQPIDLNQAARVAGCSVSHFAHLFKSAMGVSPMRYLRERRMVRARELVETTVLSIGDIGLQVGIPEPAQFSQAFRAHWHTTPSALRRQA